MATIYLHSDKEWTYEEFSKTFYSVFKAIPPKEREKEMRKEYKRLTGKDPERSEGQVRRHKKDGESNKDS